MLKKKEEGVSVSGSRKDKEEMNRWKMGRAKGE